MTAETFDLVITFVVLGAVFACFVKEWLPAELVALSGMAILIATGVLGEKDVTGIFSNSAPITIGAMFILSEALVRTGAVDWLAERFGKWAGKSLGRTLLVLAAVVVPLSAFLNNTPVVVVFLPVLMAFARKSGVKASKLLIPLSFLSIFGGTITLIGTSTNLLVAGVAREAGQPAFGIFEISKLGLIYAAIGLAYLYFFGQRLLPSRDTVSSLLDAEDTRSFLSAIEIPENSPFVGARLISHPLLSDRRRTIVYEVIRGHRRVDDIPLDAIVLEAGDVLWFRASSRQLAEIGSTPGVTLLHQKIRGKETRKRGSEIKTVEAIIGSQSSLIGKTIRETGLRRNYGVVVGALHRAGENLVEGYQDTRLQFGDTLLLEGPIPNLLRLQQEDDFLNLSELSFAPKRRSKISVAVGTLLAVVLVAAFELIPIMSAALIGAIIVILAKCVDAREAYRSIEWSILFLIYGMLGIGKAMENSGGAELLASQVVHLMQGLGPIAILAAIYLLASLLTELVTNNAVAILLTPIVISIAAALEVDPRPFIVAVMFGASASFITPIGYQTNTYVYGAGGYRFVDFVKVGVPLNLLLWVAATLLIPIFWPF